MAAFANTAELESFLQRDLDAASATLALDNASQQIRDECGWPITQEAAIAITLDGTGKQYLWLPTLRLTAVTSVVEDGMTLTADVDYRWTSYGRLRRVNRSWVCEERSVVATVTHGWPTGSEKLYTARSVCLTLAGRIYDNPGGVRSYQVGGVSETYAGDVTDIGPLLGDAEKASLAAYRIPVVG